MIEIKIPDHIAIQCPAKKFNLRKVNNCLSCDHYHGIEIMCEDESVEWEKRYVIRCACPITRRTASVKVIDE